MLLKERRNAIGEPTKQDRVGIDPQYEMQVVSRR